MCHVAKLCRAAAAWLSANCAFGECSPFAEVYSWQYPVSAKLFQLPRGPHDVCYFAECPWFCSRRRASHLAYTKIPVVLAHLLTWEQICVPSRLHNLFKRNIKRTIWPCSDQNYRATGWTDGLATCEGVTLCLVATLGQPQTNLCGCEQVRATRWSVGTVDTPGRQLLDSVCWSDFFDLYYKLV